MTQYATHTDPCGECEKENRRKRRGGKRKKKRPQFTCVINGIVGL